MTKLANTYCSVCNKKCEDHNGIGFPLCDKCTDSSTYNLEWTNKIDIRKTYLQARFLLSKADINSALTAKGIYIKGKHYKVPAKQLENAKAGMVELTLEEIA